MATVSPSFSVVEPNPDQSEQKNIQSQAPTTDQTSASAENPNSILPQIVQSLPPIPNPSQSYAPPFRPVAPQFSPIANLNPNPHNPTMQNPTFQNPNIQPPGVSPVSMMFPGVATGSGSAMVSASNIRPPGIYQAPPGQPPILASTMPYPLLPGGYIHPQGQAAVPPPGIPRYPAPYQMMVRPPFPPRPPGPIGVIPPLSRPSVPLIRAVSPITPPVARPIVPIVAPTEKPQTTVYVGKISPTIENEFLLSLLGLCGAVKSWKRAQDPSDGTPRGFGFCEFESAEGVLRALRLLSKLNVDGQELVLNVNQATREYLERYVEKKREREKLKDAETEALEKDAESIPGVETQKPSKPPPPSENVEKDSNVSDDKKNHDSPQKFGIVTDEDQEADKVAMEKLTNMMEERSKSKPPPPPPAQVVSDGPSKTKSDIPTKSKDGDSDVDIIKDDIGEEKSAEETCENKSTTNHNRSEMNSSDKGRRSDRIRDRDREKRELERYEREREREKERRDREREMKIRESERLYKERVKEWETREREKEHQRQYEKERQKEKEWERKREIVDQEDESSDDDMRKKRRRSSTFEERRRKRQREKVDDLADRLKEEEEIAVAKKKAADEKKVDKRTTNFSEKVEEDMDVNKEKPLVLANANGLSNGHTSAEDTHEDDTNLATSGSRQNGGISSRKLGFGLTGSGKRTTVPSVFHEEDDEDVEKDKKMRPLVPIDYSAEELQAGQNSVSASSPNLAAAAEFAKRISNGNPREDRSESEGDRIRHSNERSSHRDRDQINEGVNRLRDDKHLNRDRDYQHGADKQGTPENKKLLDAKQLIDTIPKTKEELFSYDINWATYDKYELHERMKPWISKKITEFLGEEETTLVDYIVSSTKEHVRASEMLELLQSILDDEAEMFVLKMWRMLIFEIKKVETGLMKSKT